MERRWLLGLLSVSVSLILAACSDGDGGSSNSASTATSAASATTTPPTTTAVAEKVLIAPDGLGVAKFGDTAEVTLAKLKDKLGAPERDFTQPDCKPEVTRTLEWGGLAVNLDPNFVGYQYVPSGGPALRTEAGIGQGSTVAQLKAAYGSKVQFSPDYDGSQFKISLPGGTLNGAAGSRDTDGVASFFAGTVCGE